MLSKVTITGADNEVRYLDIIEMSSRYPFVEWGILIGTDSGFSRFPSREWIGGLLHLVATSRINLNLSLHICGTYLRNIISGNGEPFSKFGLGMSLNYFQRCQLNFHGKHVDPFNSEKISSSFESLRRIYGWNPEVIFQLDGTNNDLMKHTVIPNYSGLFDRSCGAGEQPYYWPEPLHPSVRYGYAGGIGPKTIVQNINDILTVSAGNKGTWIVTWRGECETEAAIHLTLQRSLNALSCRFRLSTRTN